MASDSNPRAGISIRSPGQVEPAQGKTTTELDHAQPLAALFHGHFITWRRELPKQRWPRNLRGRNCFKRFEASTVSHRPPECRRTTMLTWLRPCDKTGREQLWSWSVVFNIISSRDSTHCNPKSDDDLASKTHGIVATEADVLP